MSRVGKKVIEIPANVKVSLDAQTILVEGPKGKLSLSIDSYIECIITDNKIQLLCGNNAKESIAKYGLYRSLLANNIIGVSEGFKKDLELVGVGYRVQLDGKKLVFSVGFSHPVEVIPPEGIVFSVEGQNKLSISGINKELVGQVASDIRKIRKPEPYKGKGIKYAGEIIQKKQGKSVKK